MYTMELLNNQHLKDLLSLRRWLHQNPELSGNERQTATRLEKFIQQTQPDKVIAGIGGFGLAAVYNFKDKGPTVLVRADMDALPIDEINTFAHKSQVEGVAHKCGHDGHSTILAALAIALRNRPLPQGRVVLLFQPEEETGQGAAKVIADEAFKMIQPDFVIALHNLPGFKKAAIVVKDGPFAAASKGMIIKIYGASSHAAHPEQGNSPYKMLAEAMLQLSDLPMKKEDLFKDFCLVTIIHAKLGEVAFGTNPGHALLMATLRTFYNDDMAILVKNAERVMKTLADDHNLRIEISYTEEFPATVNNQEICNVLRSVCEDIGEEVIEIDEPFRWSEDFGHFTSRYPAVMFGIGSGEDSPGLHNNDYDFPDEIIPNATQVFYHLIKKLLLA
jgi:amidohydrolase